MKIAVTGGTGFIGNYVVQKLIEDGHEILVTGFKREEAQNFTWIGKVEFVELDLGNCDSDLVLKNIAACDKLVHLVWSGLPNYKALFHFEQNLMSQYYFLKKMVLLGAKDITITGTCFEYGMRDGCLTTDMITNPVNPYALAKDTLRKFLEIFKNEVNFKLKWVRLFYMFGEGQSRHSILSQLDAAILNGDENFNMSGGEQLRDYMHVSEVAKGIVEVCYNNVDYGIFNCSSGKPISIRTLVENHLKERGKFMNLNLGYYPYPDFEPMAFWGQSDVPSRNQENQI
jgi:nucleoside-diphosphate-sugar epimerase